ncbi:lysylphosphatidylglycerol synthase transmembrane domain-containing protein [Aggregatimonas sangjinii]|uniref:lysylphosphatidylglycerol synthase transmembrane domain-containing protein n=1 Tax=Aggregatimonas sangjinii TaxID=2583587 RepID=UPI001F1C066B|nr:lysylphosphatidylglycerol synthase transmembrane domain-containing protein [Aggregatimonas sangjinii]
MGKYRKHALTALKILVSTALIYFIFTKIDFGEVLAILQKANAFYLLLAAIFLVMSKIIASYRLNLYFHQLDVRLTQQSNLKLYLLGMFYNLFLPGGIGGDAYKGYVIQKRFPVTTKRVISALLLDRLSGLLLIFLYSCLFAILLDNEYLAKYRMAIFVLALASILFFWLFNKKWFSSLQKVFWKSCSYSALVQGTQLVSVLLILKALAIGTQTVAYLFVFMLSSIVSVVPLTIGGIGSRELTFFYGAELLGLEENTAVGISMVFFLITAIVSLFGVYYHLKKPDLETQGDTR